MSDTDEGAAAPPLQLGNPPQQSAVTLKLPPFWPADPELWIAQVEAQFRTRNILNDATKYDYIVASLSPDTAGEIRELLIQPPETEKYKAIKQALLKQNEMSDQKRLQELLSKEDLGDRKPTQILRRMKQLVGDTIFDPKMLRALFVQKLPPTVQGIMMTAGEDAELSMMAEMADKIMDVTSPQVNKVMFAERPPESPSEIAQLREEVHKLTQMMSSMVMNQQSQGSYHKQRSNSRGRSPYRRQRDPKKHPLCWYHHKFGENSTKCESPCAWPTSSKNGGRSPSK